MAIKKKQSGSDVDEQHEEETTELRAGVSEQEEADAKADSKEHAHDEAIPFVAADDDDDDDDGLKEPPEGVVVENAATSFINGTPPPFFDDEFAGIGGSYTIGEDGVRRPVYEKYVNAKGKDRYRPVK